MKKILLSVVTLFCFFFCAVGCKNQSTDNRSVRFISLREGFETECISQNDLLTMANLVNTNQSLSVESLPKDTLLLIKQAYGDSINSPTENISLKYYGEYNGYYAVILTRNDYGYDAAITLIQISDVVFYYPVGGIEIILCQVEK